MNLLRHCSYLWEPLESSRDPKLLANTAKHFAFTRCGELNLYRMVDIQLAAVESELLETDALLS